MHIFSDGLVSDLSTKAFLASFTRFIARRGRPKDVYSDNGRNFIGAKSHLDNLQHMLHSGKFKNDLESFFASEFITWHTIPSYTPHMGGLWEAGIKSVKTHLKKVISDCPLTFEEFYTVLTQIEACLNSRPLTGHPDSPLEPFALTPGHFLIGAPLVALPEIY
ncbi:uncharacterized protein LOC122524518 [Polistes fuscatus]|uniref:uncharacterized protein LOC122524518 n=1 Tax=Polistes fuscatus TaxID=30207 RepID=UPI001CA8B259|nr:uncharacterized protein LOC122524518 [Polistes fuscatus]